MRKFGLVLQGLKWMSLIHTAWYITLARSRMTDIGRVRVNQRRQTLQKQRHLWQIGSMEKQ
jgi:hypothetical protein